LKEMRKVAGFQIELEAEMATPEDAGLKARAGCG